MGSRASQTLKEIEDLRTGLDEKLDELENRVPAVAKVGKKAVGMLLGGGASGSVLWMAIRRKRTKKKVDEAVSQTQAPPPAPVVVNVIPPQAVALGIAAVAVWAGIRLMEARRKSKEESGSTRVLRAARPGGAAAS
ncbi:MAG TPA: hypothetical protein VNE62_04560 [Actinomycetota bacterium]|nr:hypothetical protein [Actinomycetota bacterium]